MNKILLKNTNVKDDLKNNMYDFIPSIKKENNQIDILLSNDFRIIINLKDNYFDYYNFKWSKNNV
ncbi:MAG: hypothetical protein GTO02_07855 [Candidatus Dadabacteria bacterium]|nr:hypothetical protein [Candidatus Dadabacteria bacterium]